MKKLLLIAVIVLFYTSVYAGIYGNIELGKDVGEEKIYYTTANLGFKFTFWNITSRTYGGWFTWQELNSPFAETYTIGQIFQYRGFYVKYNHYCTHRVIKNSRNSNIELYKKYKSNPQALSIVSVGYEFEIK